MITLKYTNLFLAILGGILLWAAWPTSSLTFLIFIAWLPLLYMVDNSTSWKKFLLLTYLHMLIWNVLTTWWVAMSTLAGGLSAFLANSLIMCIPWLLYYFTRKKYNRLISCFALVSYWLAFEYIHLNWDLSWPWLTLGNAFATHPNWVQWYEYTGTSGGSLWVLLSNILVFNVFNRYKEEGRSTNYFILAASWIIILAIPIITSLFVNQKLTLLHNKYNVVVVQPNYDPWDTKFAAGKEEAQLHELISISQKGIDVNTALVVWPETAIPYETAEDKLQADLRLSPLWSFLKNNPHINLLTGLDGYKQFQQRESQFAHKLNDGSFVEAYNSVALFDTTSVQIYHKSKLVPGPEVLPSFIRFMGPLFEKFGGTMGGYAKDTGAVVLHTTNHTFNITPAICYESIYGDYLSHFNRQGTNLICIITNDGWWGNTQGYKQHMNYARLRAIESRKWIARSANTGISCFIDPFGNIIQQLPWDQQGILKQDVGAFITNTFFTKHGDWLSKIMMALAVAFLLLTIYKHFFTARIKRTT